MFPFPPGICHKVAEALVYSLEKNIVSQQHAVLLRAMCKHKGDSDAIRTNRSF
jgi:hypothetical protein